MLFQRFLGVSAGTKVCHGRLGSSLVSSLCHLSLIRDPALLESM
ncbi:hypothetical protein BIFBIF_00871 [Bifidobacterium bifidum ATCC 29521 = JCM 1255 = DSM 20456]|nr:hypothetical protein BIFBIF_00871 [Bifidobacterium bifidum ATCC 29521 = JCM 1255 = DSM 20456]